MSANDIAAQIRARHNAATGSKGESVRESVERKLGDISAYNRTIEARSAEIIARQEAARKSFIGSLGLDPDSAAGQAGNLAASAVSGISRVAGQVAALPASAGFAADLSQLSEEQIAAINRYKQGGATPEDVELINRRTRRVGTREVASNISPLERFERAMANNATAQGISNTFDLSGSVEQSRREPLTQELGEAFERDGAQLSSGWQNLKKGNVAEGAGDMLSSLAKLGAGAVKAGVSNPGGVAEYVAENLPQLLVGAVPKVGGAALAASNAGYGVEAYQKGIEKYAKENNGALPPEDVRSRMAAFAASAALTEQVVDAKMLKLLKGGDPASDATKEAVRKSFRDSLKKVGSASALGTAGETLTEGYQTYAEGEASLTPASGKDIYTGAAIGGMSGGVISTGLAAVGESAKPSEKKDKETTNTKAIETASTTGDVSALLDPKKDTYAPESAVAALFAHSQNEATPQAKKEENLAQATAIVEDLKKQKADNEASLSLSTPEGIAQQIAEYKSDIAKAPAGSELATLLTARLEELEQDLAASQDPVIAAKKAEDTTKLQTAIEQTDRRLEQATQTLAELEKLVVPIADNIALINSKPEPDEAPEVAASRTKAAEQLITLSMANVARLDPEAATELANNTSNALTAPQRAYLRAFAASRVASNALKDIALVQKEVMEGTQENLGIASYREKLGKALSAGNQKEADRLMGLLTNFEQDHRQKAKVAQRALKQGTKPQVIKMGNEWVINAGERLDEPARKKNGGFNVVSAALPDAIAAESAALTALRAELESAYELQFKSATETQEASASTVVAESTETSVESESTQDNSVELQSNDDTTAKTPEVDLDAVNSELNAESESVDPDIDGEIEVEQTTSTADASPKLDVLAKKSPEGTPYTKRQLVADYFVQVVKKMKTGGALMLQKDFLTNWDPLPYLGLQKEAKLSGEQKLALAHMRKTLGDWNNLLQQNFVLKAGSEGFESRDMMKYLLEKAGNKIDAEENIKTAMSFAAYQWAVMESSSALKKTPKEVKKMFGRSDDSYLSPEGEKALNVMVGDQDRIVSQLGKTAISVLGLKDTDDAPQDLLPKLEQALGTHILFLMTRANIAERVILPVSKVDSYFVGGAEDSQVDNSEIDDPEGDAETAVDFSEELQTLIKLKRNDKNPNRLSEELRGIKEANTGSMDVVTKLFVPDAATRYAETKPSKFIQKFAKRTKQTISKMQRRVMQATMNTPHKAIEEMLQIKDVLGKERILKVMGYKEDTTLYHQANYESIEAQNQNLERQYDIAEVMLNNPDNPDGRLTEFYVVQEVWKNFRAGFTTQSLNQQTSKYHRFMFARPSWKAELRLDDTKMMEAFKVSVAQAFGINIDKQKNAVTIQKLMAELANPELGWKKAIDAIRMNLFNGQTLTDEQSDQIAKLAADKEGMMTLQALVAYAKYEDARINKKEKVEGGITMLVGADGKTNGPMLTNLALGAADTVEDMYAILNRGGMYEEGQGQPTHYAEYKAKPKTEDLYENLMAKVLDVANSYMKTPEQIEKIKANPKLGKLAAKVFTKAQMAAFQNITKELISANEITGAGRNLVKTPLTSFNFGSSLGTSLKGMENKYVKSLLTTIEDIAQGKRKDVTAESYVDSLNTLIQMVDPEATLIPKQDINALLKLDLAPYEKNLRKAFRQIMDAPVQEGMKEYFTALIERRTQLNKTIQASYWAYQTAYQTLREQEVQRLAKEGVLASRVSKKGERIVTQDLSRAQEQVVREKLKAMLPTMHTEQSLKENDSNGGLYLAKRKNRQFANDIYRAEVSMAKSFKGASNNYRSESSTKLKSYPIMLQEQDPGVSGTANSAHSIDSSAMHNAIAKVMESMNVHDEIGQGVGKIGEAAAAINRAIFDTLLNYSPSREAFNTLERLIFETAKLVEAGTVSPEIVKGMLLTWTEIINKGVPKRQHIKPENAMEIMIQRSFGNAYAADQIRLGAIARMGVMDQYPWEGGSFTITQELRDKANKQLEALATDPSAELMAAVKALNKATANVKSGKAVEVTVDADEQVTRTTPWGDVGTPAIDSDARLVAFFEANPETTASRVMEGLVRIYTADNNQPNRKFNLELLGKLKGLVAADLPIVLITPNTPEAIALDKATQSRGWYTSKGTDEAIYVLNNEFVHSGLTPELLIHELVHAALVRKLANPESMTADEKAILDELKALQKDAAAYAEANGIAGYEAALGDIQEFVAWGMTNQSFQKDVLTKFKFESKTKGNALIEGMKAFIEKVAALLFKNPESMTTGLGVLVTNVSGLMAQAAQTPTTITQSMATVNAVDNYTTVELFDALESPNNVLAPSFNNKLKNLLTGIVDSLHGPLGSFHTEMSKTAANGALAVYLKAMQTGKAPFASLLTYSGLSGSEQETFVAEQVEATIRAALDNNGAQTELTFRKLSELYTQTRKNLKPSDFDPNPVIGQAQYDFLFRPQASNGNKSDYLSRFAAWGLANQQGSNLVRLASERDTAATTARAKPKSFAERLQNVLEDVLQYFQKRLGRTFKGQDGDLKLEALVGHLVDIEAKRRASVKLRQTRDLNYLERVEEKSKELGQAARAKIEDMAGKDFFVKNNSAFIRMTGSVTRMVAGQRVEMFMDQLVKQLEIHKNGKTLLASTLTELKGMNEKMKALLRASKGHERERKGIADNSANAVLSGFANEGKALTPEQKAAVSAVFLRTGTHHLLKHFKLDEVEKMLAFNSPELATAINDFETKLDSFGKQFKGHFIYEANVLGSYVATNHVNRKFMKMNAHNIVMMYGTPYEKSLTPAQYKDAKEAVEALVTLYGLSYMPATKKAEALSVLKEENKRGDQNGVEFVLKLHQKMEQESLDRLFQGHPELMIHGYVPDVYNPHTEVLVANEQDGEDLLNQGYTRGQQLPNDPADPRPEVKHLYVLKDGGLLPRVSGIFSFTGQKAKGNRLHNGYLNINNQSGLANAVDMGAIEIERQAAIKASFAGKPREDLSKERKNFFAPVFNETGQVVNWRYLMSAEARDTILDRDNRFEKVIGTLAASIYDKETSREQNKEAIKALRDQYNQEYKKDPSRYTLVGYNSTDPEMREIWDLLPEKTRQDVRAVWGDAGMMVRTDALDILFGYRKLSAGTMFKTAMKERKLNAARQAAGLPPLSKSELGMMQKVVVSSVEGLLKTYARTKLGLPADQAEKYAMRAANYVTKGERGFQEMVREVKDIIVVKSVVVLVGNIVSNFWLLALSGVSIADIAKHHLVAMKGATAYQADYEELRNLERQIATGFTQNNDKAIQDRIIELKDAIARNPVTPLIDAGLMPTIVEDVASDDDPYSYKSALTQKLEKASSKLNENVVSAARTVYMTRDTKLYQGLSRLTTLSDFVGRYTLYQHLISKKVDPLTEEEAIQKASDYFINYDIPMHRSMQYVDDMGVIPFMKYFLRIQRVLADVFANNPARVLATIALGNYMDLGSTVLESSALERFGNNPFRGGAFGYPEALTELGTVNGAMTVFK
jgi:hypothetical protein